MLEIQYETGDREQRMVMGFNLYASRPIESHDRKELERQLRCMGRPPISEQRLTLMSDGHIVVKFKKAWGNGVDSIILTPHEFLERLIALVPFPRRNIVRFYGVFAPHAQLRQRVVSLLHQAVPASDALQSDRLLGPKIQFARLMKRVFDIDILSCPRCNSTMKVISFVTEQPAIRDILLSLKMTTAPPEVSTARVAIEQEIFAYEEAT